MAIEFEVSTVIAKTPQELYNAWLDSGEHARMTGAGAKVSDKAGEAFEAWDGYIQGKNLELEPGRRIIQAWRTSEFSETDKDSVIEVLFEAVEGGTKITLMHTNLPPHGKQYEKGWHESYFQPMKAYFEGE